MSEGLLHLKVVTPSRVVVEEDVDQVTLPGALGALGILPGHAPLLAALRIGELSYVKDPREYYLAIQWGFVEVAADVVTVLAEVAELPAEIDVAAAEHARIQAEEAMRTASGAELDRQRARVEAAVTQILVAGRR
jgi:F-type H+-transporting ATPase subunit epsilon